MPDALVQPWCEENAYLFPPFNLINKCLKKISFEGATLLIVCPLWHAKALYLHLQQLLKSNPALLPIPNDLQLDPLGNKHPLIVNNSLPLNRMESLRDHLSSEGIILSKEATDILFSAQCRSTNAQYKPCWAKWCCW